MGCDKSARRAYAGTFHKLSPTAALQRVGYALENACAILSRLEYGVFDTHSIARTLASADLTTAQVDAITDAVRQAAEHDAAAEPLATRSDLFALESRIYRAMLTQAGTIVVIQLPLKHDAGRS